MGIKEILIVNARRSAAHTEAYQEYLRSLDQHKDCPFCSIRTGSSHYINETDNFWIIRNRFPYEVWEGQSVLSHLMIVPKNHLLSLKHLSESESKEFILLMADYEHSGYNVYARTASSRTRSIEHQHTHLIQLQ
jgi:diadenosine tetraphosphate (Ap4A) HIT family hydrolase